MDYMYVDYSQCEKGYAQLDGFSEDMLDHNFHIVYM